MRFEKIAPYIAIFNCIVGLPSAWLALRALLWPSKQYVIVPAGPVVGSRPAAPSALSAQSVHITPTLSAELLPYLVLILALSLIVAAILIFILLRRARKMGALVLSPLQFEALRLANEILGFLEQMGARPQPNTPENESWTLKSESQWRRDFAKRVREIAPKFGIEGIDPNLLLQINQTLEEGQYFPENVFEVAKNLFSMAHELDTAKVVSFFKRQ